MKLWSLNFLFPSTHIRLWNKGEGWRKLNCTWFIPNSFSLSFEMNKREEDLPVFCLITTTDYTVWKNLLSLLIIAFLLCDPGRETPSSLIIILYLAFTWTNLNKLTVIISTLIITPWKCQKIYPNWRTQHVLPTVLTWRAATYKSALAVCNNIRV